jgi:protein-L-isoaspartate(D-aspartate) O-methyltransferase
MAAATTDLARKRRRMVEAQIAARGVRSERVLQAMRTVPREAFVPDELAEFAYVDGPLPIGEGQTISQPYIVGLMAELADPGPDDKVLDVGTGSGYAAAVLSRIAARVYTVERHAALADTARRRLERLGYDNVEVRCGDGTLGWPEAAPFDAIVVAAGGPAVPGALREQLEVGGRLVIPVATDGAGQTLLVVRRTATDTFEEEDCGAVAFVPLVGEQGWRESGHELPTERPERPRVAAARSIRDVDPGKREPAALIAAAAEPLPDLAEPDFGRLADRFGDARVVLMGEATHGTSEFYRARAELTKRLIVEHGFTAIAVEADWPDAARIDRYVRGRAEATAGVAAFTRFPTWMWRNVEVQALVDWLHAYNQTIAAPEHRIAFYGLDLYSLHASIAGVLDYLDRHDPEAAQVARERYACLTPWQHDPASYGRAALRPGFRTCEQAVLAMLGDLLRGRLDDAAKDGESFLDAAQNARLVAAAERYYRIMYYGGADSWNLRDLHMFETLQAVLAARGPDAKAVVWAHNSHVGDARATEMGKVRDELNIGQLCREAYGASARLLGFGTDRGSVAAASDWDGPMEIKQVRPAHEDSYERLCRESGRERFLLGLGAERADELRHALLQPRLERAIGVIYRPETELLSHYFEAQLPRQFDAWLWFEETSAVTPLGAAALSGAPETYPFGL